MKKPEAHRRSVLPGYHATLGVPVLAGRTIAAVDTERSQRIVVVSEALANEYWPDESPIGSFIIRDQQRWEVVGVVADVLHRDLTDVHQSTFYFPFLQQPPNQFWLVVKSEIEPDALVPLLRSTVGSIAPEVAIGTVERLEAFVQRSTAGARYRMVLVASFAVCALFLAAMGIFGVTARMVVAHRRELGIRLALGAKSVAVTRAVVVREASALLTGVTGGLLLLAIVGRALEAFFFGISPYDLTSLATAVCSIVFVGIVASYLPARRIADVSPAEVLKAD